MTLESRLRGPARKGKRSATRFKPRYVLRAHAATYVAVHPSHLLASRPMVR